MVLLTLFFFCDRSCFLSPNIRDRSRRQIPLKPVSRTVDVSEQTAYYPSSFNHQIDGYQRLAYFFRQVLASSHVKGEGFATGCPVLATPRLKGKKPAPYHGQGNQWNSSQGFQNHSPASRDCYPAQWVYLRGKVWWITWIMETISIAINIYIYMMFIVIQIRCMYVCNVM